MSAFFGILLFLIWFLEDILSIGIIIIIFIVPFFTLLQFFPNKFIDLFEKSDRDTVVKKFNILLAYVVGSMFLIFLTSLFLDFTIDYLLDHNQPIFAQKPSSLELFIFTFQVGFGGVIYFSDAEWLNKTNLFNSIGDHEFRAFVNFYSHLSRFIIIGNTVSIFIELFLMPHLWVALKRGSTIIYSFIFMLILFSSLPDTILNEKILWAYKRTINEGTEFYNIFFPILVLFLIISTFSALMSVVYLINLIFKLNLELVANGVGTISALSAYMLIIWEFPIWPFQPFRLIHLLPLVGFAAMSGGFGILIGGMASWIFSLLQNVVLGTKSSDLI